jgi:tetratricopeptide (TPR) repeat protein
VLGLKAVNCRSGDTLAEEQVTAASKEKVLDTLGQAASKLRGGLGESLATVQKLDVPLSEATTSSLEALKAYSLAVKASNQKGNSAALSYDLRAIQLDPNFALGYNAVGDDYYNLGELGRASEYYTKAFQLREHASEREKLSIDADYYRNVTGELDKAAQTYQEAIESYPRRAGAYGNLGNAYGEQGQYEKAAEITRQAVHLAPDSGLVYANLANFTLALQRFDETRQTIREAQARKLDDFVLHSALYALAFLGADAAAMTEQQQWFAGKPEENLGLALASDTEAYGGHVGKARELTRRAVDSAIRADSKENGAIWQANAAVQQAAYGNAAEARQSAAEALKLAPASQGVEVEAALVFAMAGDTARAESLAQDLGKRFPLDTQVQSLWLPAIQAQLALNKKNPACRPEYSASYFPHGVGDDSVRSQSFLPLPCVCPRRSVLGSRTRKCCRRRVSEDSRPQRHCLELLDGSPGTSGSGSRQCSASEDFAGRGCRCRPRPGARRLQRFSDPLEGRRPRHPHSEGSQSGVREAAITVGIYASTGTEPDRCREICSQQLSEKVGLADIERVGRRQSTIAFHGFLSAGGCTISKSASPWW